MSDINEDDIDYSVMQFTPLPHAVGKIWFDSSSDSDDEDEFVIENWATKEDEDEVKQHPVMSFDEIEEMEEKEEYENTHEFKQKHLYHPPTQVNLTTKNMYGNNEKESEDDNSNFDDANVFANLANSIEEPAEIVVKKEQRLSVKNTENNEENDDEKQSVDGKERENYSQKNILKRYDCSYGIKTIAN